MKKIIHIDMDAFFVSVEIRDNPSLAGKPVGVGGKSSKRGVLSTCNYIARNFGVSSAMPTTIALKKCPQLIIVPARMQVYKDVSHDIRTIFEKYTSIIEPLSLDEAYLDVTNTTLHGGSATLIAQEIREEIFKVTGLTASAGISSLKFVAKVASDLNKPNGQCTIAPSDVDSFLEGLSLQKIPGVGKVTFEKLQTVGIETCGDVKKSNQVFLTGLLGKFGHSLWQKSHGIDERDIKTHRIRKSVGVERTFEFNLTCIDDLNDVLKNTLVPELNRRSAKYLGTRNIKKLGVKVKFHDFTQTTKEQLYSQISVEVFSHLLNDAVARGEGKSIRLLGVHLGLTDPNTNALQMGLDF